MNSFTFKDIMNIKFAFALRSACLFGLLPITSAAALYSGASIYKWNKAAPMPGLASRNFTLRGTTATVREGGEIIMVGRGSALDLPGTTDVHIEIDPRSNSTIYAGLVFKDPCGVSILNDGTLVARDYVMAHDLNGKYWRTLKMTVGGKQRWVFNDDLSEIIQDSERRGQTVKGWAQEPGLLAYTMHGDAIWKWNAFQAGMVRAGGTARQGMTRTETVAKNCGRCGKAVNLNSKVGQHCPHCGAYWGAQDSRLFSAPDVSSPQPGAQSCFIATAAYGSPWEAQVLTLRKFRDCWLLTNTPGRWFVATYYQHSPPLAGIIAHRPWLRAFTRTALTPLVVLARASQGSMSDIGLLLGVAWATVHGCLRLRKRWLKGQEADTSCCMAVGCPEPLTHMIHQGRRTYGLICFKSAKTRDSTVRSLLPLERR